MLPPLPPPPGDPPPKDGRDSRGRFSSGAQGRKRGSKNRATLAIEALFDGEAEAIGRRAIELALKGDTTAMRLVLERAAPVRRGRAVEIPGFPKVESIADVGAAHSALIAAVAAGDVTPDEAKPLSDLLASFATSLDIAEMATRLEALEKLASAGKLDGDDYGT